jgi:Cof subfamily protein (haloacid dehalogenase superfamily)
MNASGAAFSGRVRLIAVDLDGTLLRNDRTLSARSYQALKRATRHNVYVVIATARPPRDLASLLPDNDFCAYAACCNGALTYAVRDGAIVDHRPLHRAEIIRLVRRLKRTGRDVRFAIESGTAFVYEHGFPGAGIYQDVASQGLREVLRVGANPLATKLLVSQFESEVEDLARAVRAAAADGASVTHSSGAFVEVGAPGTSKATALAGICRALGVARSDVVAFGDMPNDAPMLEYAGLGVAVGNAHPALKQIAHIVTGSNDEDGVAVLLDRLIG